MRNILLSAACLLFTFVGFGQCPGNDVVFTTQAQIDSFALAYPNCTVFKGRLESLEMIL